MKIKTCLYCIMILFFLSLTEKNQAQPPKIPQMWVSKSNSIKRTNWFSKHNRHGKKDILTKIIGQTHPSYSQISVSGFDDLMKNIEKEFGANFEGLNVYITSFDAAHPGPLKPPAAINKQLVVVFAPAKVSEDPPFKSSDLGKYYILNSEDSKPYEITENIKNYWTANYEKISKNELASTLKKHKKENYDDDGKTTDTRCIFYFYDNFREFISDERTYQDNNPVANPTGIKISHIRISFAAYTRKGIGSNSVDKYKHRLILLFDFIRDGKIVYIDDDPGFRSRPPQHDIRTRSGDNGQLCPPSINCPEN